MLCVVCTLVFASGDIITNKHNYLGYIDIILQRITPLLHH